MEEKIHTLLDLIKKNGDACPDYERIKELTESEEQEYKKFLTDPDGIYKNVFFGHGHCSFDWENLIHNGIEGVMAQIEARKSRESAKDKLDYLEGMALVLTAIEQECSRILDEINKEEENE